WFLERDAGKQETQVAYDLLQTAHIQTQIAPQNGSTINFDDLPIGSLTPSPTSLGLPTSIITATSTDLPTPIPFSGTLPSSTGPVRVPYLVWTGNHIGVASSIAARVYEANKLGADPQLFQASNADIFSVDISPDQTRLVMGGGDGVV